MTLKPKCLWFILVVALIAGCATGSARDGQTAKEYRTGATRQEIVQQLGGAQLLETVLRPAGGWSGSDTRYMANRAAAYFEKGHHGVQVQSCDVYWIARNSNSTWALGGIWWDYLFFDANGKLIGYQRRFLD